MDFLVGEFANDIEKFAGVEGDGPLGNNVGGVKTARPDFEIGGLNADAVFLGGKEQMGKDRHRPLGLDDALNFLHPA